MVDNLAVHSWESWGAVRHSSRTLWRANFRAKVSFLWLAENAVPRLALGCIARYNEVTNCVACDTFTEICHDGCSLMTENTWEFALSILSRLSVHISVAKSVRNNLNSNFASLWWAHLNVSDYERCVCLEYDGRFACNHASLVLVCLNHCSVNTVFLVFKWYQRYLNLPIN